MRRVTTAFLVTLVALFFGAQLSAQEVTSVSGGILHLPDGDTMFMGGFRAASGRPDAGAVDFGLQIHPRSVAHGILMGFADLGLGYNIALDEQTLLTPRVGRTALVGLGPGGGGAMPGVIAGVALVQAEPGGTGLRVDLTYRAVFDTRVVGLSLGYAWRGEAEQ